MYALDDNGTFRLMESLPPRLRLADGLTRTALDELDSKQLAELGIYPVKEDKPDISTATQVYGEPKLYLDGETVVAVYPVLEKTKEQITFEVAEAKTSKLAELAEARWLAETGGLTLPDGTVIKTDRESQALLTGAAFSLYADPTASVEWKADKGKWVDLDSKQVLMIAGAVRQHVQGCFSRERDLSEKVNACTSVDEVRGVVWG